MSTSRASTEGYCYCQPTIIKLWPELLSLKTSFLLGYGSVRLEYLPLKLHHSVYIGIILPWQSQSIKYQYE